MAGYDKKRAPHDSAARILSSLCPWTYGYEILKGEQVMYEGKCGQVWLYGCSWDTSAGVIHTFEFEVERP